MNFDFDFGHGLFGSTGEPEKKVKQDYERKLEGPRCTSCNAEATRDCLKCRKKCICNNPTCSLNHNRKFHNAKTIHERSYA